MPATRDDAHLVLERRDNNTAEKNYFTPFDASFQLELPRSVRFYGVALTLDWGDVAPRNQWSPLVGYLTSCDVHTLRAERGG